MLHPAHVDAYLWRIGYTGSVEPTLHTLRNLHLAHLLSVPFENLDICSACRKQPIVLDEAALFDKIVTRRRGGFCYELNGLFAALLSALGYRVELLSARVPNDEGRPVPDFDHLVLRVTLDDEWLSDVGFGEGFRWPLRLSTGRAQPQGEYTYCIRDEATEWTIQRRNGHADWRELFRFTPQPRRLDEFRPMCLYHQSSPESPFTRKRLVTLATPDGRITLTNIRLIVTRYGRRTERTLRDEAEVNQVLSDVFGIRE